MTPEEDVEYINLYSNIFFFFQTLPDLQVGGFKEENEMEKVLKINKWETPATYYPLKKVGSAEITRGNYGRGFYWMEGVDGYVFFQVTRKIPVTNLEINGKVCMVDDPLHWIGMQRLSEHSKGKVLVGGLGLGLIIHALGKNPKVVKIDVAEINKDVIELVKPLIPRKKTKVYHKNVFDMDDVYDTVILDLWVYNQGTDNPIIGKKMVLEMISSWSFFKSRNPGGNVYIWGHCDPTINPTVDGETIKIIKKIRG